MATAASEHVSRRSAVAIAAALTATVATAMVAYGGLRHWAAAAPAGVQPAAAAVQVAPPFQEESD